MTANPLLFIAVALTLGVILVNGWTDAPNAIATCVSTRSMKPGAAILMAAVFNLLGVVIMTMVNQKVASTIFKMVNFGGDTENAVSMTLGTTVLSIFTIPIIYWVLSYLV